jgi:site-specific recombinase XerD
MPKHKVKIVDALNAFLDRYENEQTVTSYRADLDHFVDAMVKLSHSSGKIANVSSLDIQTYVGQLRKYQPSGRARYAPATINKKIKSIKAFFAWALRSRIIRENPALELRNARVPDDSRKMRMVTVEELDRLLTYCSFPARERERALVMFLGDTGVRRGGCADLTVGDIDFPTGTVWVTEKGLKTHQVYPGDACLSALRGWLIKRGIYEADSYVFSRDGKHISASAIAQYFRRICIAAGIGSRGPHEMRRFKITQMLDAGLNARTVQKAVNHANVETTLRYVKKTTEDVRTAMHAFSVSGKVDRPRFRVLPKPAERAENG